MDFEDEGRVLRALAHEHRVREIPCRKCGAQPGGMCLGAPSRRDGSQRERVSFHRIRWLTAALPEAYRSAMDGCQEGM